MPEENAGTGINPELTEHDSRDGDRRVCRDY